MKIVNGIKFGGQYEDNLESFEKGKEINVHCFYNGTYVATTPFSKFISKLDKAGYKYTKEHTTNRKNKGYGSMIIKIIKED